MPLNLLSAVAKIPFGKYKGWMVWEAPKAWFEWASNQDCANETLDTLIDALEIKQCEGQYAVLRKSKKHKFLYKLKSIHTALVFAEAQCKEDDEWKDYVYSIVRNVGKKQ